MIIKTPKQRFLPVIINVVTSAALFVASEKCAQLEVKNWDNKSRSRVFNLLKRITRKSAILSTCALPFTTKVAADKYGYTEEDYLNGVNLLSDQEKQDLLS